MSTDLIAHDDALHHEIGLHAQGLGCGGCDDHGTVAQLDLAGLERSLPAHRLEQDLVENRGLSPWEETLAKARAPLDALVGRQTDRIYV